MKYSYFRTVKPRGVRSLGRAEIIPSEPAPGNAGEGKAKSRRENKEV